MKPVLKKPIESMVQGMAYWIAYSCETKAVKFVEAEAVGEMANMLKNKLSMSAVIKREVDYRSIDSSIKGNKRADLGIFWDDKCQCLLEVKLSENTNGGYISDIKKLAQIKRACPDIDCYVILLYRKSCTIDKPVDFVSKEGRALHRNINIPLSATVSIPIRIRRVAKAIASTTVNKMKKVVCIEITE